MYVYTAFGPGALYIKLFEAQRRGLFRRSALRAGAKQRRFSPQAAPTPPDSGSRICAPDTPFREYSWGPKEHIPEKRRNPLPGHGSHLALSAYKRLTDFMPPPSWYAMRRRRFSLQAGKEVEKAKRMGRGCRGFVERSFKDAGLSFGRSLLRARLHTAGRPAAVLPAGSRALFEGDDPVGFHPAGSAEPGRHQDAGFALPAAPLTASRFCALWQSRGG